MSRAPRADSDGARSAARGTSDSILAATPDGLTEQAAQVVETAADNGLSPARLGAMLVTLGGSLRDEDDVVILLQRIVEIATQAIDGAQSAGVTVALGGRVFTAVHTDDRTLDVDAEQYAADEGPCLHAARTGETVLVDVEESAQRWPHFAASARREGIRSFLAAPLHTADLTLGALNLYGTEAAAFHDVDADILEVLTATASRTVGEFARFKSATETADDLRAAIAHRMVIEQAKGMLMAVHQIDPDTAFAMLCKESQATNCKLRDVSSALVARLSSPE